MAAGLATLIGSSLKSFAKNQAKKKVANAGKNMLNRKANASEQNKDSVAENSNANVNTGEKKSPIAKPTTSLIPSKKVRETSKKISQSSGDPLIDIQSRLIEIEKIVAINFRFKKTQEEKLRVRGEQKEFKDREDKLEKGLNVRGFNFPFSIPGKGLFDNIMGSLIRFIMFIALGKLLPTIIKLLPTLKGILTTIGNIVGSIAEIFGSLLDGLIGFATWVDGFKENVKDVAKGIGGENLVGIIEGFESTFNQFLNLALIAGMLTMSSSESGPKGKPGSKSGRLPGGKPGTPKPSAAKTRYFRRFGKDRYIQRFGQEAIDDLPKGMRRGPVNKLARNAIVKTLGKGGTKTSLKVLRKTFTPLVKRIPVIGALVNFALDVFVFKEHPGRSAFKAIGAGLIGFLAGALGAIAGPPGVFVGGLLGGMAGDALGGMLYDAIFSGKKPSKVSSGVQTKNRGGRVSATRGGKPVGGKIRRTVQKTKQFKKPNKLNIPLQPGKDVGGISKIKNLYNAEKKTGLWSFTKIENKDSPFYALEEISKIFKDIPFIGNWMGSAIDIALGQKPPDRLYQNYADSLGYFISNIVQQRVSSTTSKVFGLISKLESGGTIASAGSNIRDIQSQLDTKDISETISTLVRSDMDKALQVVRNAANIKIAKSSSDPAEQLRDGGGFSGGDGSSGDGSSGGGSSGSGATHGTKEEKALLDAIAFAEGTTKSYGTMFGGSVNNDLAQGKLTVAEAIKLADRHARKNGRSGASGRYQFLPQTLEDLVRTGDLNMNEKFTPEVQDRAALALARRRGVTASLLKKEGLSKRVVAMLAPEWASFPTSSGDSFYSDQSVKGLAGIQNTYKNSLKAQTEISNLRSGNYSYEKPKLEYMEVNERAGYSQSRGRNHMGRDIAVPNGTPLYSITDARITSSGKEKNYGYYVTFVDANGWEHFYGHMRESSPYKEGDKVKAGSVVGYVGSTGRSTGDHLHWEVSRKEGEVGFGRPSSSIIDPIEAGFDAILPFSKPMLSENIAKNDKKVIRSFKVGGHVYTEREGGVYTQNGKPITKQLYDAVVKNHPQPSSPSPLSRPAQASPSSQGTRRGAAPSSTRSSSSRPSGGRGAPPSAARLPAGVPDTSNILRNATQQFRFQGGGHIAPTKSKNYGVDGSTSYEINKTKVVFFPIPSPQKSAGGNGYQASLPVTAMKFTPTSNENTNINPHFVS